jgi:hypothetical protein
MPISTEYIYPLSSFPNTRVDSDSLVLEINRSAIITALDHIDTDEIECHIWFKDPVSAGDKIILDGLVSVHLGDVSSSTKRSNIRIKPYTAPERNLRVEGFRQVCTLNGDTTLDISFPEEREIQGALLECRDFTDGDYVSMYAVHPVAGVLIQWANNVYVSPDGQLQYDAEDAKTVPAGIILRIVYHSVATSGPQPVFYAALRMWL